MTLQQDDSALFFVWKFSLNPQQGPHHSFAINQLSSSFKILTDKAICRGSVLTQRSKAPGVELLV